MGDLFHLSRDQEPLTETTFFILLSLVPDPQHGYGIMKDVAHQSRDRIQLSTGTLYGAINRLLEQKWIEPVEMPDAETRRPRKCYRLTPMGETALTLELQRLNNLVTLARLRKREV